MKVFCILSCKGWS